MRFVKPLALLAALCLLFTASLALALEATPAAASEVVPGDSIAYTYSLATDMEPCVLRLSLGPGLILQENSVQISSEREAEVVYGSDGFVVMADKLDKGATLTFAADVSSSALEIWAQLTAGDGSISEEEGYAAHILVLPAEASQATAAPEAEGAPDSKKPGTNALALLIAVLALAVLALFGAIRWHRSLIKAQAGPAAEGVPAQAAAPPDNTVEYLVIPDAGEAGPDAAGQGANIE